MHKGSCLCGAVSFTVEGELKDPDGCHCGQCRKSTGHFLVSTDIARERLTVKGEEHVGWYASSEKVRRGFCRTCGSTLFWDPIFQPWTAIAMGAFDKPTGVEIGLHIHTASKGDYYEIGDGRPQYETTPQH
jgi:hypothetical protein